jgi:hypothetical protein
MKKFTCLLVTLLAIQYATAANCPGAVSGTGNSFQVMLAATTDFTASSGAITAAGTAGTAAGATFCANTLLCCTGANLVTFVNTRLANLKTALTTFGVAVSKFGGYLTKVAAVASNTNISTYLTSVSTDLLITDVQAKAFLTQYATPATYTADFTAFTGQLVDCFTQYKTAYNKIACHACTDPVAVASVFGVAPYWVSTAGTTSPGEIAITKTSCGAWVDKCIKVFTFLHRVGGAVHVAAYINKKRDSTKTAVIPTFAASYVSLATSDAAGVTAVITAIGNCAADSTAATCTTTATTGDKTVLCKAFIKAFDATMPIARLDVTNLNADPTSSYPASRRQLVPSPTGAIVVAVDDLVANGVDLTSANAVTLPDAASPTTFATTDYATWSTGYVAPTVATSSSATSTTKSAKVVIGTILSALFAVAFLN